jgi:hypothetical protein
MTATSNTTFDISRDCTLVGVEVGLYPWSKKDTVAASNAATAEHATADRFTAYIQRLSKQDRLPPQQIAGEARKTLDFPNGSAWDGKGLYLIPNTKLESTLEKLEGIKHRFYQAVDELVQKLPALEAQARLDLNGAFDRLGFPTEQDLREKYRFVIRQSAIVSANDLRLNHVSPAARAAIETSIRKEQQERVQEVQKSCVDGIESALKRVVDTLPAFSEGKVKRFEDTLITGLAELAEALPALNLTKDPAIDRTLGHINTLVARLTTANTTRVPRGKSSLLRGKNKTGEETRKEIAKQAGGILAALKAGAVSSKVA